MIERFTDSLRKSSSRAKEFTTVELEKKPKLFVDFIEGLKVAAGSAHQIAHAQMNPKWLDIRDKLEKIIEVGQSLPSFANPNYALWLNISESLSNLAVLGNKMFVQRALSRKDVDKLLDQRMANLPELKDSPLG